MLLYDDDDGFMLLYVDIRSGVGHVLIHKHSDFRGKVK